MFPLKASEPYILETGIRSTLGEQFGGSSGDIQDLKTRVTSLEGTVGTQGTEIQALTNELTDEAETRAALGAHNLWDLHAGNHNPSVDTTETFESNGLRIQNTVAHDYAHVDIVDIPFKNNLDCILTGTATITSGAAMIICEGRKNGANTRIFSISPTGAFAQAFNSGDYETLRFYIYCTKGTSELGNVLYSNLMIRLTTDSDTTYQPYAMTNKELTDSKADKSDLASISITGTTNNTGSTIASGTYFYLNGALVKAKTSISNGATLTANTNYVAVTAGSLNDILSIEKKTFTLSTTGSNYFTVTKQHSCVTNNFHQLAIKLKASTTVPTGEINVGAISDSTSFAYTGIAVTQNGSKMVGNCLVSIAGTLYLYLSESISANTEIFCHAMFIENS